MDINRDNYEAWLLDLVEGRLNDEETRLVREFLLSNPDCAEGLEGLEFWELQPESVVLSEKEMLKKEIPGPATELNRSNFDLFSVARLEGDLTDQQLADHQTMVDDDADLKREWEAWQQTKLHEENIQFEGKKHLKKATGIRGRVIWISVVSAAAVMAILFSLIRMDRFVADPESIEPPLAQFEELPGPDKDQTADNNSRQKAAAKNEISPEADTQPSGPASLSIRKHQDPPELIGEKLLPATDSAVDGQGKSREKTPGIEASRLNIAHIQAFTHSVATPYDRIEPMTIPSLAGSRTNSQVRFEERSLLKSVRDFTSEKELSLVAIADAGIRGINRMTGSEMALNVARDQQGKVSGYRFNSAWIKVDAPVEKSE